MTYLVVSLASCLFFAQLLGLLLGWLLWGYISMQRKKEIVMLRKRLADSSMQTLRPLEDPGFRASLPGARDRKKTERLETGSEAILGDLPPLVPIPPEQESVESSNGTHKDREAVVLELQRQVETLKSQLSNVSAQKETHTNELKGQIEKLTSTAGNGIGANEANLLREVDQLKAQLARVNAEKTGRGAELEQQVKALTAELNSTSESRDRSVFEAKAARTELEKRAEHSVELERRVNALTLEMDIVSVDKEKASSDLKTAKADFEKRSAWLTKRIHELERSAEEWERTKQELTLSRRVRGEANGAGESSDGREGVLAELKDRLEKMSTERDALAAEVAQHKNGNVAVAAPEHLTDLQEQLRNKDTQLTEQVARVERLLWRVSELESASGAVPQMEEKLKSRDERVAALTNEATERDAHIRTLLRRMTELEPLNEKVAELQAALVQRDETGPHVARLKELEESLKAKDAEIGRHLTDRANSQTQMIALNRRLSELEQVAASATVMEASLREKQAAIAKLQASHSEQAQSIGVLKQRVEAVEARAQAAEQELAAEEQQAQGLRGRLEELTPLPGKLQDLADKHHSDLTRLKVSSAQRIRKLRQGITGFKG